MWKTHTENKDNPHAVTKAQVGLSDVPNYNTMEHVNNDLNPHAVTKAQVGLGNVQNFGVASQSEAVAGTVTLNT